ncbi:hypothetical protein ACFX1R_021709 [Malus domestica]
MQSEELLIAAEVGCFGYCLFFCREELIVLACLDPTGLPKFSTVYGKAAALTEIPNSTGLQLLAVKREEMITTVKKLKFWSRKKEKKEDSPPTLLSSPTTSTTTTATTRPLLLLILLLLNPTLGSTLTTMVGC